MARRLSGTVHVRDDAGDDHMFTPADEVPGWAAEKITNPKAWDDQADGDEDKAEDKPAPRRRRGQSDDE